jgi:hypothetical protein
MLSGIELNVMGEGKGCFLNKTLIEYDHNKSQRVVEKTMLELVKTFLHTELSEEKQRKVGL